MMNTHNDFDILWEEEERTLYRLANVHNCLEMLQGSGHLGTTPIISCTQDMPMAAVGYRRDTEEIVNAS